MIKRILAAVRLSDLALTGETEQQTYRRLAKAVHPDTCSDPDAGLALSRLTELKGGGKLITFTFAGVGTIRTQGRRETAEYVDYVEAGASHSWVRVYRSPTDVRATAEFDAFAKGILPWTPTLVVRQRVPASGGRHLSAAYCKIDPGAGDLFIGESLLNGLPPEHASWIFRRCLALAARCQEAGLSPDMSAHHLAIGPISRALVLTSYRKGDTMRTLMETMHPTGMVRQSELHTFCRKVGRTADPNQVLRDFDQVLIKVYGKRTYTPLLTTLTPTIK
jgi:hypothetical protein